METASSTPVPAALPAPAPATVATTWPRSAQLATAFLLGVAGTLLIVHMVGSLRWGSRPSDLERGSPVAYRIDLNRASRAELLQVPGIGPALADRIADHQRQHGDFRSVDELRHVHGIGPATLERVRPWLCVNSMELTAVERRSLYPVNSTMSPMMDTEPRRPAGKKETALATPIDINRAGAEELQKLSGIGPVLSQRIIDERGKRSFKSVDELSRVRGIGPKTLERLRGNITVGTDPLTTADPQETAEHP